LFDYGISLTSDFFLISKPKSMIPNPIRAPNPYAIMMKKQKQRFLPNLSFPSFQSIPRETAGLKWPPLIGPKIYAITKTQAPTAIGPLFEVLLQL
jgi:hypothetical protein